MSDKKQDHIPRSRREPDRVHFRFTEKDLKILQYVNLFRYMKTEQVFRLIFEYEKCRTNQSTRKRLKYLYHGGYLGRVECFTSGGQGSHEIAYYLDQLGVNKLIEYREEIEGNFKITPYNRPSRVKHRFLGHSLAVTDFCINLILALRHNPHLELVKLSLDFEIKSHMLKNRSYQKKDRYLLFDQIKQEDHELEIYPDILFVLQIKDSDIRKLFFVEVDNNSERSTEIRKKALGYSAYKGENKNDFLRKYGKYARDYHKVLFTSVSEKRSKAIQRYLEDLEGGTNFLWITNNQKLTPETLLNGKIWTNHKGETCSILAEG